MFKKRLLALMLVAGLALTGCGGNNEKPEENTQVEEPADDATDETTNDEVEDNADADAENDETEEEAE